VSQKQARTQLEQCLSIALKKLIENLSSGIVRKRFKE
jgi:hypothetical protein